MKKTLQKLSLLMTLMVVGMTSAWAQDEIFYSLDCPASQDSPIHSTYAAMYETTVNGIKWNAPGNQYEDQAWRIGGKSITNEDRYMYTMDAINATVTKVVVKHGDINGATVNSFTLNVYTTAEKAAAGGEGDVSSIDGTYGANSDYTFVCPDGEDWTDCYYRFTWNITVTQNSNKFIKLAGIDFFQAESGKIGTTVTYTGDAVNEVVLGEDFTPARFVVDALDESGETTALYDITLTYSSSNENVATVDENGDLTIVGDGATTITATYAGDDTYAGGKASYTLNVYASYNTLEDVIAAAENTTKIVIYTFNGETVDEVKDSKNVYITNGNTRLLIYGSDSGFEEGDVLNGTVKVQLQKYSGEAEFKYLTTSTEGLEVTKSVVKEAAIINIEEHEDEVAVGNTIVVAISTRSVGGVTVSSSNEDVATVEEGESGYVITGVADGTVVITVTTDEDETYKAGEDTFTIKVVDNSVEYSTTSYDLTTSTFVYATTNKVVWSDEIASVVADKAGASTNTNNYLGGNMNGDNLITSSRFYKNSALTITPAEGITIKKVEFKAATTNYATALANSTWENATAEADGMSVTVSFIDGTKAAVATIGATTGHSAITVYYTGEPTAIENYTRTVDADNFGTLCLDYDAVVTGAEVYDIAGTISNDGTVIGVAIEQHEGKLVAGVPYVFKATASELVATLSGVQVTEPLAATGLVGSLDEAAVTVPEDMYVLSKNVLRQVQGGTVTIGQNRAYFDLSSVPEYGAPTAGVKVLNIFGQDATAIKNLTPAISEGEGVIFNLAGQQLNGLQKGINIVGGKKVLVK